MSKHNKFENFLLSFGAARLLLQKAHNNGSLIEGLILYASLVDGFCRICLVLREQVDTNSADIDERYIHQGDKKNFSEREIYRLAYRKKIITKKIFEEMNDLYDIRNRIVHRFFLSEVKYSCLEEVCGRYELLYNQLWQTTHDLETLQIKKGVGMTAEGNMTKEEERAIFRSIMKGKIS